VDIRRLHGRIGHASHAVAERMPEGMKVLDVVLTGRDARLVTWLGEPNEADRGTASERLADVGCEDLAERPIATCSQGERQRILLARAMFGRPDLLILDEPAAGLDLPGREHLIAAIGRSLRGPRRPALVMATHHLEEIPPSTTHALLLRDGRALAAGPTDSTLTSGSLSACFDMDLIVGRHGGRWTSTGR
jgi:iron complex transport system ATP-binding protein